MRLLLLLLALSLAAPAQTFTPIPAFPLNANPLVITRPARPNQPFSITGQRGAILGQQDGTFELWALPVKVLHNARLTATLQGYDATIDLNDYASSIEVRPDHTTITYAHPDLLVRQHMFLPQTGTAAIVLFEVHSPRAAVLTLSFTPSMERMWPAPNFGRPNGSWIPRGTGGAYALDTDNPAFFGMVAMPSSQPGPLRPYQERPKTEPLSFRFTYDPAHDDHVFYPLLAAVSDGTSSSSESHEALLTQLLAQAPQIPTLYRATSDYFAHFFDRRLTVTSPDPTLNDALRWAQVAIEQSRVATPQGTGLAGGWFTSGDSARPGFGWFFGRDTLWTLYAVNATGDFALARTAMDLLLAHQRPDGKMMHELSQTAPDVDWIHLPYLYASADSTPLFVMQMEDYVRASGDLAYLQQHWDAVKRAYAFTRAHTSNGVYDNTQGTGWVEEWTPAMPHQEIYLAALDQQSAESLSRLAHLLHDDPLAASAAATASDIRTKLAAYRTEPNGGPGGPDATYAFSRNADGSYETVPSIFPAVAFWSGRLTLPQSDPTFQAWSGPRFATDWGLRSVATDASIYDPISYHHGSVWPLYTGWVALAQYRTARPLQAFANLRADAQLTWLQDPGALTEVLSGKFLEPLGRSSSHQLWSSAMLLTPTLRGLFGLQPDAPNRTLRIAPQLPADWNHASLDNLPLGDRLFHVEIQRLPRHLEIDVSSPQPEVLCLTQSPLETTLETKPATPCTEPPALHHHASVPLPPVEISLPYQPAQEGDRTQALKVIDLHTAPHQLVLKVEAPAGTIQHLHLRRNDPAIHTITAITTESGTGASIEGDDLTLTLPPGQPSGLPGPYIPATLTLHW